MYLRGKARMVKSQRSYTVSSKTSTNLFKPMGRKEKMSHYALEMVYNLKIVVDYTDIAKSFS